MMEVISKHKPEYDYQLRAHCQLRNGSRVSEMLSHWSSSLRAPRVPPTKNRTGPRNLGEGKEKRQGARKVSTDFKER